MFDLRIFIWRLHSSCEIHHKNLDQILVPEGTRLRAHIEEVPPVSHRVTVDTTDPPRQYLPLSRSPVKSCASLSVAIRLASRYCPHLIPFI